MSKVNVSNNQRKIPYHAFNFILNVIKFLGFYIKNSF